MNDAVLLRELFSAYLARGDDEAMDQIVRRTRPRLLAVARRIGAPQDAEDSVQAAYLALIRRRPDAELLPWLVTVVVRSAFRRKALERRQAELARKLAVPAGSDDPASAAAESERRSQLRRDVARLPARYRDPLVLHYLEGVPTPDVARLLDLPEATVRTRLHRGRALLRGRFPVPGLLAFAWLCVEVVALGGLVVKNKAVFLVLLVALLTGTAFVVRNAVRPDAEESRGVDAEARDRGPPVPESSEVAGPPEAVENPAAGPRVAGVVLDDEGRPVAGARVALYARADIAVRPVHHWGADPRGADASTNTDAAGRFELPLREDVAAQELLAMAEGFSPVGIEGVRAGDDVVVRLERGPVLHGRIRNLAGEPVAGARVSWWSETVGLPVELSAVSGANGAYRLEGLPSPWAFDRFGGYSATVRVDADGFPPLLVSMSSPGVHDGDEIEKDFYVVAGARLDGRVLNGHGGGAIAGARILVQSAPVSGRRITLGSATSAEDGSFVVEGVPARGFHGLPLFIAGPDKKAGFVRAEKEGFATVVADLDPLEPGATGTVTLECWPVGTVLGRVVDRQGRPLEGVAVSAHGLAQGRTSVMDPGGSWLDARTDRAGRFRFDGAPGPGTLRLALERDGWRGRIVDAEVRPGEEVTVADVVWDGPRKPAVDVEVVDGGGTPVWGATVRLTPGSFATTGRDGRVRMWTTPEAQSWEVEASARGLGRKRRLIRIDTDQPASIRLVLDRNGRVEGVVRWSDGEPAAGAVVAVKGVGGAHADRSGRFVLRGLPAGPFDLQTTWAHPLSGIVRAETKGVRAGARDVPIVLERPRQRDAVKIVGRVSIAGTGKPVLFFHAILYRRGQQLRADRPAPGRFRFPAVPLGAWTLRVHAPGFAQVERSGVVLRLGEPLPDFDIELQAGAKVHGRIRAAGVPSLLGGLLVLRRDDGFQTPVSFVTGSGRYSVEDVPAGRYRPHFVNRPGSAPPIDAIAVVKSGRDLRFDFSLVPGGSIRVGQGRHRIVAADGTVVFDGTGPATVAVPPGEYAADGRKTIVTAGK